jgi:hypothetical protein
MLAFLLSCLLSLTMAKGETPPLTIHQLADTCITGKDKVTGRTIYFSADTEPQYVGEPAEFQKQVRKSLRVPYADSTQYLPSTYVLEFIVETNGKISGERVTTGTSNSISKQLFSIARGLHWIPATCHGKKVAMLWRLAITVDFSQQ